MKQKVRVLSPLGMHARPAAAIVAMVQAHDCTLKLIDTSTNTTANGRSVISLLSLGAPCGSELEVLIEGSDACELMQELVNFFENGFGEMS